VAIFSFAASILLLSTSVHAQKAPMHSQTDDSHNNSWNIDSANVHNALKSFLTAFENLDWETFRKSFDDQATVFFPLPEPPERFEGRAAYEARFWLVFSQIRKSAPNGPPFHRLNPENLHIENLGHQAVLATFHLRNSERIARRTIVFQKTGGTWLIRHLHASNVVQP
jgi:hypothetical protein